MDQVKKTHKGNLGLRYSLPFTPSSRLCMLALDLVVHILSIIKQFTFFLNRPAKTHQSPSTQCSGAPIPAIQGPVSLPDSRNVYCIQIVPPSVPLVTRPIKKDEKEKMDGLRRRSRPTYTLSRIPMPPPAPPCPTSLRAPTAPPLPATTPPFDPNPPENTPRAPLPLGLPALPSYDCPHMPLGGVAPIRTALPYNCTKGHAHTAGLYAPDPCRHDSPPHIDPCQQYYGRRQPQTYHHTELHQWD
jgi:hypothetical protein